MDETSHRKIAHGKRTFAMTKHPHVDSPAYDASEGPCMSCVNHLYSQVAEDNDPLTDDAASAMSVPVSRSHPASGTLSTVQARTAVQHRNRHQTPRIAAVLSSDDGVDSPTYDGDIESSSTAVARDTISSASTPLASPTFAATSTPDHRLPALVLQVADSTAIPLLVPEEPSPPPPVVASEFNPATLTPEDIRAFVGAAIDATSPRPYSINPPPAGRPIRIYADGESDGL
jgi:choline-phosphate cytidylyltransferase